METLKLKVWGENGCFTRPEMKVERVSYDVMTPSAARGILEAILWKPAIEWQIEQIDILAPIRWESVRRNEVGAKIPLGNVESAMRSGTGNLALFIEEERQQRAGLFLRNPAYVIHAKFTMTPSATVHDNPAKFAEMFRRRVEKGQCHHMPCLGCREFPAYFAPPREAELPIPEDRDLGWMLYDLDFSDTEEIRPKFFRAQVTKGRVTVPPRSGPEVVG